MTYIYVTFKTTHEALNFEELLKGRLPFWLVPVPRELSHHCGIAARFADVEISDVEKLIAEQGASFDKIHKLTR